MNKNFFNSLKSLSKFTNLFTYLKTKISLYNTLKTPSKKNKNQNMQVLY